MPGISDDLDRDDLDVLSLAGLAPPSDGDWLLVTSLDSQPAGRFTAQHLHRHELHAHGGDVLVRVAPDTRSPGQPKVRAQVWAVMAGRLVLAGNWDQQSPDDWPEQVRPAVAFAMGMITELEESGADLGPLDLVRLGARRNPARIHRVIAGNGLRGITTPVRVHRPQACQ